jgi:hypothetical protein
MILLVMARLERFELPTPWFVAKYSIQLSYRRVMQVTRVAAVGPGRKSPYNQYLTGDEIASDPKLGPRELVSRHRHLPLRGRDANTTP